MDNRELWEMARKVLEFSYSPYSNFPVGAALLTKSGKVYLGTNIENASYGLTICAERVAIFKAVSEGEREFLKIVIVGKEGQGLFPCGSCRQVMAEFSLDLEVILYDLKKGEFASWKVRELLPLNFTLKRG
ncbi:MAG: cytidine deaminase [Dictyoglomus sp.]|nr:cytidine deaminase [Dictyoglomus sp.]MCX7941673.1 cytidine deaminase [Dictyoglomaceae bacterium]MDW8188175.1 cytidine deaminase [Dictyoglomus sp.]